MGAMKSKSEQLEEYLLSEIRNRVYKAGDKLPSETRLQQKFGISRVTIRNSLKKLTDQGYIYSVKGCGWFVSGSISERLYQSPQNDALKKIGIVFPHKIEFFKSLYTFLQTECKSNGFQWEFFFNTSIQSEKNAFDFFVKEKFDAVILSPNRWQKKDRVAIRSRTADGKIYDRAASGNVCVYGGNAGAVYRPLHFQFCRNVQKTDGQYARTHRLDRVRQGTARRGTGRHCEKVWNPHTDVRYQRRLFVLRHTFFGLRHFGNSRKRQRLRISGTQA